MTHRNGLHQYTIDFRYQSWTRWPSTTGPEILKVRLGAAGVPDLFEAIAGAVGGGREACRAALPALESL